MKRVLHGLLMVIVISLIGSCSSSRPVPSDWPPEKNAIRLHVTADTQLNFYDGVPHTLLVCLYQLRSPNVFNQLADDKSGIYKLLECTLFDGTVARSKRLIFQPGQDLTMDLDRGEGAKYVGIVAGYILVDKLEKERIVRLFEVPLIEEKKGLLGRERIQKPGPLHIELALGPQQIHSSEVK